MVTFFQVRGHIAFACKEMCLFGKRMANHALGSVAGEHFIKILT